ncbi:MAG: hypothetical protein QOF73_4096, partial [Thermomicrobiales bacterium]|nr:hypothetical protein [Thermomicrobiales bacterium]
MIVPLVAVALSGSPWNAAAAQDEATPTATPGVLTTPTANL